MACFISQTSYNTFVLPHGVAQTNKSLPLVYASHSFLKMRSYFLESNGFLSGEGGELFFLNRIK